MRTNLLSYIMESVANGQMKQAVEIVLRNKRTRPAKILNTFHALLATEQGDKKDILLLMVATARELENERL